MTISSSTLTISRIDAYYLLSASVVKHFYFSGREGTVIEAGVVDAAVEGFTCGSATTTVDTDSDRAAIIANHAHWNRIAANGDTIYKYLP